MVRISRSGARKREFKASLWREDGWVIAQCLEVDVANQGRSEEEALAPHFEAPRARGP